MVLRRQHRAYRASSNLCGSSSFDWSFYSEFRLPDGSLPLADSHDKTAIFSHFPVDSFFFYRFSVFLAFIFFCFRCSPGSFVHSDGVSYYFLVLGNNPTFYTIQTPNIIRFYSSRSGPHFTRQPGKLFIKYLFQVCASVRGSLNVSGGWSLNLSNCRVQF